MLNFWGRLLPQDRKELFVVLAMHLKLADSIIPYIPPPKTDISCLNVFNYPNPLLTAIKKVIFILHLFCTGIQTNPDIKTWSPHKTLYLLKGYLQTSTTSSSALIGPILTLPHQNWVSSLVDEQVSCLSYPLVYCNSPESFTKSHPQNQRKHCLPLPSHHLPDKLHTTLQPTLGKLKYLFQHTLLTTTEL